MESKEKNDTGAIDDFRGDFQFLSNFLKSPMTIDGITYRTVEHAFQAAKCLDKAEKLRLANIASPVAVKRAGRKVKLREDWEQVKLDLMYDCLSTKFAAGSPLCEQLLSTGDQPLVEGNTWHDNFWGSCKCAKHKATTGKNHLGKLLMRVRDDRRAPPK